jgi:uncharacterized protein (DUF697 family)
MNVGEEIKDKRQNLSNGQLIDSEQKKIIAKATAKASTVAALPVPLLDVVGVVYIQIDMVKKLANSYNIEIEKDGKLLISSLLTAMISKLISEAAGSLAVSTKVEKIFGESLIKATISGFLTTVVGDVYNEHFRAGGSVDSIGIDDYIDYFKIQAQSDKFSVANLSSGLVDKALDSVGI